jgi:hypothetical protein
VGDSGQATAEGCKPELSQAAIDASMAAVDALDLTDVKRKVVEATGWPVRTADYAELRYRRFLCMHHLDRELILVPHLDIDAFWHQHILFTRNYARDCERLFGEFFHHNPGRGADDEAERLREILARTAKLYADAFGEDYLSTEPQEVASGMLKLFG